MVLINMEKNCEGKEALRFGAMKLIEARESYYHAVFDVAEMVEIINLTARQYYMEEDRIK